MNSKEFWLNGWHHIMSEEKCDSEERRAIIRRLCFGPLETDFYGIEKDKFYHEYHYIEGLLEGEIDFYYISKEKFMNELEYEIKLSMEHKSDELTKALLIINDNLIDS